MQGTPADAWDYDGVNELVLADLPLAGKKTPVYLKALWNTIVVSGSVTLLCVLLGYPLAYTMAHAGERLRRLLLGQRNGRAEQKRQAG